MANIFALLVMVLLSEYLLVRQEQQPIELEMLNPNIGSRNAKVSDPSVAIDITTLAPSRQVSSGSKHNSTRRLSAMQSLARN